MSPLPSPWRTGCEAGAGRGVSPREPRCEGDPPRRSHVPPEPAPRKYGLGRRFAGPGRGTRAGRSGAHLRLACSAGPGGRERTTPSQVHSLRGGAASPCLPERAPSTFCCMGNLIALGRTAGGRCRAGQHPPSIAPGMGLAMAPRRGSMGRSRHAPLSCRRRQQARVGRSRSAANLGPPQMRDGKVGNKCAAPRGGGGPGRALSPSLRPGRDGQRRLLFPTGRPRSV